MALGLIRAGKHGEYEQKFLESNPIYFTWDGLKVDLSDAQDLPAMYEIFRNAYSDEATGKIHNWGRKGPQFTLRMEKGDWVALPSKFNPVIHFGKITGHYQFDPSAENPYFHSRSVDWFAHSSYCKGLCQ